MKKISLGTLFSLVTILVLFTAAFAETTALPGSGWWSGEQIQNVGTANADVSIVAYDANSANTYETTSNLDPGEATTFLPWSFTGLPAGFEGSAVVSSASDIRAVANITVKYNVSQGVGDPLSPSPATGQYQGVNAPATAIYYPLVKNNHFNKTTNFAVQNAGDAAATATATFRLPSSTAPGAPITTFTFTTPLIQPNKRVIISPADAGAPNGNGIVGSLTVTSAQPLAGTSMEFVTGETHPTVLQTIRAFTADDFATSAYAPTVKYQWFSRNTGLQVQNVSGGQIDITVTYKGNPDAAACANQTYVDTKNDLDNGLSWTFPPGNVLPSNCLASATVTATGNIVATMNEAYNPIPGGTYQEATTYNVFPSTLATTIVSIPLFKENSFGKKTGLSIQNVGGSTANNVVAKFIGPTGTYRTQPLSPSIPSGGMAVLLDVRNKPAGFWNGTAMTPAALGCAVPDTSTGCGANGIFGVIITADQPIVVIANETAVARFFLQDKNNYEGFNLDIDPTAP